MKFLIAIKPVFRTHEILSNYEAVSEWLLLHLCV